MTDIQNTSAKNGDEIAQSQADPLKLARQFGLAGLACSPKQGCELSIAESATDRPLGKDDPIVLAKAFQLSGVHDPKSLPSTDETRARGAISKGS